MNAGAWVGCKVRDVVQVRGRARQHSRKPNQ